MKSLIKFVTSSLIIVLVSFAGSFCLHPMPVQAAASSMDMSLNGQNGESSGHSLQSGSVSTSALNMCTFDCVKTMPQVIAAKKTSVASTLSIVVAISQTEQFQSSELSFYPSDVIGTSPPSPDMLFSVVKRE